MGHRYSFLKDDSDEEGSDEESLSFATFFTSYEWSVMYDRCAVCFSHHLSNRGINIFHDTQKEVKFCSQTCKRYYKRVVRK